MKASVLFGAGWENDSVRGAVARRRDAPSADCGVMTLTARGTRSYPSLPMLSIRPLKASIASHANSNFESHLDARGHCGRWNWCASADRRCSWSITQEASRSIA